MTVAPAVSKLETGRVVAIAGPVVDVEFPPHALPEINHAVSMDIVLDGRRSPSWPRSPNRSVTGGCDACA